MGYINLPLDSEGFSIFTPSTSTRIMYISEDGDDDDGVVYAHDSFADPFNPVGASTFATYLGAFANCRDDYPDWILYKRGESFIDHVPTWQVKRGYSETEPFLVGAYGSGDLPLIKIGTNIGLDIRGGVIFGVYTCLDIYSQTADPESPDFDDYNNDSGFNGTVAAGRSTSGLLIEACKFRYTKGTEIQLNAGDACEFVKIRRNLFHTNYSATTYAQGLFASEVDNFIIKENIFYHNGWLIQNETGDQNSHVGGQATWFSHSIYTGLLTNTLIEDNLLLESAGAAVKITSSTTAGTENVIVNNNLMLGGIIGTNIGNNYSGVPNRFKNISITNNVMTDIGWSRPTLQDIGRCTFNSGWDGGEFTDNLLINQRNPLNTNVIGIYHQEDLNDLTIAGNIVYNLMNGEGLSFRDGFSTIDVTNVAITDNIIQMPSSGKTIANVWYDDSGELVFSGNKYYTESTYSPFNHTHTDLDFAGWVAATGDTSTIKQVNFFDETRDIESYNVSIGGSSSIQDFLDGAVLQDRDNWDSNYFASTVNDYLRAGFTEVFMTTTFNAPNTWNNSNNSYKYPEVQALIDADALQNLAGDGSVMFDGSGNALGKTQAALVALPEMNANKQMYGCFEVGGTGLAQYENTNTESNDIAVKDYLSCFTVYYLVDNEGNRLVDNEGNYLREIGA